MASRKKIGLLCVYDESWAGGLYYVLNILRALTFLPNNLKPEITIFYSNIGVLEHVKNVGYPFLNYLPLIKKASFHERLFAKVMRTIKGGTYKYKPQYSTNTVDFIFPCDYNARTFALSALNRIRVVYWIPDFQHKHLPHFFSQQEIQQRDERIRAIAALSATLVLSSHDSLHDFTNFFPGYKVNIKVIPFATILPEFAHISISTLKSKFRISRPYFISPNQFWKHKNHMIILQAALILKKKGFDFQILFTGKEYDHRNPDYATSLKQFTAVNDLENNIQFLGFIDRAEQLQLMKHSIAVVQPSLFEGWSTVVEDSKAMDQILILSDLKVHHEQCGEHALYFNPGHADELAAKMEACMEGAIRFPSNDYQNKILSFARQIIEL
jgi:glycosyltransferase involved in cell wall biosynthesis